MQKFPAIHTRKQRWLKTVNPNPKYSLWYNNIMRLGYRPSWLMVGWMHSSRKSHKSLDDQCSGALNCKLFTFNHQQKVKSFGRNNWTTQQLWTALLILPDAPRCSQIGRKQRNVLSGALRLPHRCSSMLRKLWNRIQEYHKECIAVCKMLPNQTIRMCKFQSYWE